jgi:[ribosomal protein S18]-alanine N-acetyltransferase
MKGIFSRFLGSKQPSYGEVLPREAREIASLHAASFQRGWSEDEIDRLLVDRNVLAHRARIGRALAGFIISRIAADEAEILSVAVARMQRGRGLAQALLRLHLGRLAGLGVRSVFLEVGEDNEAARRIYDNAGFEDAGRREAYYAHGAAGNSAALLLRRDLA